MRRGEYRLREPFRYLEVSTNEWSRMRDGQREEALLKIHSITVEEATSSNVTDVTKALSNEQDAVMKQIVSLGIDWLPHEILSSMVTKANSLAKDEKSVVAQSSETVIVKSNSDPRKPHKVNIYPNGKGKCDNCPGFTSSSICAHVLAACIHQDKLESFLRWFVKTKRNSGGINYTAAIAYGMPKGRGTKGGIAPRRRGTGSRVATTNVVPRTITDPHAARSDHPHPHSNPPLRDQFTTHPSQFANHHYRFPSPAPGMVYLPSAVVQIPAEERCTPGFPSPAQGQFIVYLLKYCPQQTSICFGCSNALKQNGAVLQSPGDLVIVSKMARVWAHEGVRYSKPGNVYFHCNRACVQLKQPYFDGSQCIIPLEIERYLTLIHKQYLRITLGI